MTAEIASLKKSLTIYRGLVEVSGLIGSITDYDELLRAILDVARRVIRAEAASLFFVNTTTGDLDLVITSTVEGQFEKPKISVPKGRGIAGWVFAHAEALLIPDAYADERFYKEADKQTGFRTRSILCTPLLRGDEVVGVLQILNPRDKESFEEEDLDGFRAYANLTATAIEKLRALEERRRQERMRRDLDIAAEIQSELLSRAIPPEIPGARFAAFNRPAANVGGDFYDVFVKSPEEIYFAIGDVSGKGISASLLMAQTLSAMQFVFASAKEPAGALCALNDTLSERIVRGMFVTALLGKLNPSTGEVVLASAGHCKPLVVRAAGGVGHPDIEPALPLGILPGRMYSQTAARLGPGDLLVAFTDGLTESKGAADGEFFESTIPEILAVQTGRGPEDLVAAIIEAERLHRREGPQADDLTILVGGPTPAP